MGVLCSVLRSQPARRAALRKCFGPAADAPFARTKALTIHGSADVVVPLSCGQELHELVQTARIGIPEEEEGSTEGAKGTTELFVIEAAGHKFHVPEWRQIGEKLLATLVPNPNQSSKL